MCFTKPGLDPNALDAVVTEKGRERLFLRGFHHCPRGLSSTVGTYVAHTLG